MKKPNQSTLFIIAGILFLISAVIGDDTNYAFAIIGFMFIIIGISKRKKEFNTEENSDKDITIDNE